MLACSSSQFSLLAGRLSHDLITKSVSNLIAACFYQFINCSTANKHKNFLSHVKILFNFWCFDAQIETEHKSGWTAPTVTLEKPSRCVRMLLHLFSSPSFWDSPFNVTQLSPWRQMRSVVTGNSREDWLPEYFSLCLKTKTTDRQPKFQTIKLVLKKTPGPAPADSLGSKWYRHLWDYNSWGMKKRISINLQSGHSYYNTPDVTAAAPPSLL